MFLTREMILNANDFQTEIVHVVEWGGDVMVKSMSGTERDAFEASIVEMKNGVNKVKLENMRAKLVAKTVVDPETKKLLFTVGDIEALGAKSAAALDRVFSVARKLSKLADQDVDELIKN